MEGGMWGPQFREFLQLLSHTAFIHPQGVYQLTLAIVSSHQLCKKARQPFMLLDIKLIYLDHRSAKQQSHFNVCKNFQVNSGCIQQKLQGFLRWPNTLITYQTLNLLCTIHAC